MLSPACLWTRLLVERLLAHRVIRRVDDLLDLRRDASHHGLEPLSQRNLRNCASLAPAAHGDGEFSVPEVNDRNLSAVESDGTVELPVQQFLNDGADFAV